MNKILIIDDDIAICELIKINLELQGYSCLYSTDPTKGFALVKQERPSLIILDVMMGNISGYSVAQKIRQTQEISKTPIIMLTALGELHNKLEGFNSGVDDYMTKPFEIEELKARVLALLNRSGQEIPSLRIKEILSDGIKQRIEDGCSKDDKIFRKMFLYSELFSLDRLSTKEQKKVLKKQK